MDKKQFQALVDRNERSQKKLRRYSVTWYVPSKTDVTKKRYEGVINIRCSEKELTPRALKLAEQLKLKYNLTDADNLTFILRSIY